MDTSTQPRTVTVSATETSWRSELPATTGTTWSAPGALQFVLFPDDPKAFPLFVRVDAAGDVREWRQLHKLPSGPTKIVKPKVKPYSAPKYNPDFPDPVQAARVTWKVAGHPVSGTLWSGTTGGSAWAVPDDAEPGTLVLLRRKRATDAWTLVSTTNTSQARVWHARMARLQSVPGTTVLPVTRIGEIPCPPGRPPLFHKDYYPQSYERDMRKWETERDRLSARRPHLTHMPGCPVLADADPLDVVDLDDLVRPQTARRLWDRIADYLSSGGRPGTAPVEEFCVTCFGGA
jgi:hypothetical protein